MGRIRSKLNMDVLITFLAICMVIYHIASVFYLFVDPNEHQNIHLLFALVLIFLASIESSKKLWPLKLFFVLLSIVATGYIGVSYNDIQDRLGFPTTPDVVIGVILIVLCLEGTRRAYGPVLPLLVLAYICYALLGHLFPEPFKTIYYPVSKTIGKLAVLQGIYGFVLGTSANFIFLFILFGSLLQVSGATHFFVQVGRMIGKRSRSGPALSAVMTSCLLGTSNPGVSSNIIITGSFTIPLMKRVGYAPHQAAAIEASASTGGQIMPPVMGVTAFIMSGVTGIPYVQICLAALIPAILYYVSAGLYTHLQAGRLNVGYIEEKVDYRELVLTAPLFLVPLITLILLMAFGYSPVFAVTWSMSILALLSLLRRKTRPTLAQWLSGIKRGAVTGAEIGVSCALVGAIVATSSMTGLVIQLPSAIEAWSGGVLYYGLVITACVSIILGCGVTIAATYILVAMMAAPALITMGLTVMQAHLFAFYFAVMSFVTPPLALAALFACRIAKSSFFITSVEATKISLSGFIVPFLMILCPALIFEAPFTLSVAFQMISILLLLVTLQVVICNYFFTNLTSLERVSFLFVAAVFFAFVAKKSLVLFFLALCLFVFLSIRQRRKRAALQAQGPAAQPSAG